MMAPDRCEKVRLGTSREAGLGHWTPGWTEDHSRSYGLKEAQVQLYMDEVRPEPGREGDLGYKPGPGQELGRVQSVLQDLVVNIPFNSTDSHTYFRPNATGAICG